MSEHACDIDFFYTFLESSREHLETKKTLEELRNQYGSEWLQSQAGHMVKNVIGYDPGLDKEYESVVHYQRSNITSNKQQTTPIAHTAEVHIENQHVEEVQRTSTPIGDERSMVQMQPLRESPVGKDFMSESRTTSSEYKSVASNIGDTKYESVDQETISTKGSLNLTDIYRNQEEADEGKKHKEFTFL